MQIPSTPGWYPDSEDPNKVRYWDGVSWGDSVLAAKAVWGNPGSANNTPRQAVSRKPFLVAAVALIVLFAVLGFIAIQNSNPSEADITQTAQGNPGTPMPAFSPTAMPTPSPTPAPVPVTGNLTVTGATSRTVDLAESFPEETICVWSPPTLKKESKLWIVYVTGSDYSFGIAANDTSKSLWFDVPQYSDATWGWSDYEGKISVTRKDDFTLVFSGSYKNYDDNRINVKGQVRCEQEYYPSTQSLEWVNLTMKLVLGIY